MRKLDYDYVANIFSNNDCVLLDKIYLGIHHPLLYRCVCGETAKISLANFRKGQRCADCRGGVRYSFEYVKKYFADRGCKLLETEYVRSGDKNPNWNPDREAVREIVGCSKDLGIF